MFQRWLPRQFAVEPSPPDVGDKDGRASGSGPAQPAADGYAERFLSAAGELDVAGELGALAFATTVCRRGLDVLYLGGERAGLQLGDGSDEPRSTSSRDGSRHSAGPASRHDRGRVAGQA